MLSRFAFNAEDAFENVHPKNADESPVPLKSQRKTERRAYMGHIYVSPKTHSDGITVSWRCKYKSSMRCNGRMHTDGNVVNVLGMHCHEPDPTQVEVEQMRDNLRERATASMEDPMRIVSTVLQSASEDSPAAGPSRSALRQVIYRVRKDVNQASVNKERRKLCKVRSFRRLL